MSESLVFFFWFLYFLLVGSWISFVFFGHHSPPTSSLYVGFIVVVVLQVIITFNEFCNSPGFQSSDPFFHGHFFFVWFLLFLNITLPCSFGSLTLLPCDSKLQPIKIAQFFRMGRGYGKVKKTRQFVTPMKNTVNWNYYAGWLRHPSEKAFFNYLNDINVIKSKTP